MHLRIGKALTRARKNHLTHARMTHLRAERLNGTFLLYIDLGWLTQGMRRCLPPLKFTWGKRSAPLECNLPPLNCAL